MQEYGAPIGVSSKLSMGAACHSSGHPSFGPPLELRTIKGEPLFMRLAMNGCEVAGEKLTVVHMRESTLAAAVDERRLKLHVSTDGCIMDISHGTPKALFGFPAKKVGGAGLWRRCVCVCAGGSHGRGQAAAKCPVLAVMIHHRLL